MPSPLRLSDKALLTVALAVAVALFATLGHVAMAPRDPLGAVSLMTGAHPVLMFLETAALAAVAASIATLLAGSRLVDVGAFAAAVGMAVAAVRGQTAAYLLTATSGDAGQAGNPAMAMLVESLLWSVVLLMAMVVSAWVTAFCTRGTSRRDDGVVLAGMSATELPRVNRLLGTAPTDVDIKAMVKTALVVAVVAVLVFSVLVSGSMPRTVRHGQSCFAVFVAFYCGVRVAKAIGSGARTPLSFLAAVPLAACLAYGWAMVQPADTGRYAHLDHIPASVFLRALPLTFVSVGVVGVLVAYWTTVDAPPRSRRRAGSPARRAR